MVYHMGANIMVDVVNPSIVTVNGGKSSPQVTPFLHKKYKFFWDNCKFTNIKRFTKKKFLESSISLGNILFIGCNHLILKMVLKSNCCIRNKHNGIILIKKHVITDSLDQEKHSFIIYCSCYLPTIPRKFLFMSVVMQIGDKIKPHHKTLNKSNKNHRLRKTLI